MIEGSSEFPCCIKARDGNTVRAENSRIEVNLQATVGECQVGRPRNSEIWRFAGGIGPVGFFGERPTVALPSRLIDRTPCY